MSGDISVYHIKISKICAIKNGSTTNRVVRINFQTIFKLKRSEKMLQNLLEVEENHSRNGWDQKPFQSIGCSWCIKIFAWLRWNFGSARFKLPRKFYGWAIEIDWACGVLLIIKKYCSRQTHNITAAIFQWSQDY